MSLRTGVDVHVMIDALAVVMSNEDKDLCKVGELVMAVIMEMCVAVLGSKKRVGVISKTIQHTYPYTNFNF